MVELTAAERAEVERLYPGAQSIRVISQPTPKEKYVEVLPAGAHIGQAKVITIGSIPESGAVVGGYFGSGEIIPTAVAQRISEPQRARQVAAGIIKPDVTEKRVEQRVVYGATPPSKFKTEAVTTEQKMEQRVSPSTIVAKTKEWITGAGQLLYKGPTTKEVSEKVHAWAAPYEEELIKKAELKIKREEQEAEVNLERIRREEERLGERYLRNVEAGMDSEKEYKKYQDRLARSRKRWEAKGYKYETTPEGETTITAPTTSITEFMPTEKIKTIGPIEWVTTTYPGVSKIKQYIGVAKEAIPQISLQTIDVGRMLLSGKKGSTKKAIEEVRTWVPIQTDTKTYKPVPGMEGKVITRPSHPKLVVSPELLITVAETVGVGLLYKGVRKLGPTSRLVGRLKQATKKPAELKVKSLMFEELRKKKAVGVITADVITPTKKGRVIKTEIAVPVEVKPGLKAGEVLIRTQPVAPARAIIKEVTKGKPSVRPLAEAKSQIRMIGKVEPETAKYVGEVKSKFEGLGRYKETLPKTITEQALKAEIEKLGKGRAITRIETKEITGLKGKFITKWLEGKPLTYTELISKKAYGLIEKVKPTIELTKKGLSYKLKGITWIPPLKKFGILEKPVQLKEVLTKGKGVIEPARVQVIEEVTVKGEPSIKITKKGVTYKSPTYKGLAIKHITVKAPLEDLGIPKLFQPLQKLKVKRTTISLQEQIAPALTGIHTQALKTIAQKLKPAATKIKPVPIAITKEKVKVQEQMAQAINVKSIESQLTKEGTKTINKLKQMPSTTMAQLQPIKSAQRMEMYPIQTQKIEPKEIEKEAYKIITPTQTLQKQITTPPIDLVTIPDLPKFKTPLVPISIYIPRRKKPTRLRPKAFTPYKRKEMYVPSLVGVMERITAKKVPVRLTGLEVRPMIPKARKKKKKKRRMRI